MTKKQALKKACKLVGGKSAMARLTGVTRQAVQQWLKKGLPAERVVLVEKATGGEVKRHQLRPDLWTE